MKYEVAAKFDVIIIGSGISGLLCAIELAKNGKSVFIGTKEAVTESSSLYAQGGMAVPLSNLDSAEKHLEDTLNAGSGLCDLEIAKEIISYSKTAFDQLVNFGVKFDLNNDSTFHQTKEAAHTFPRVVHAGGDASGRFITKTLIDNACREPNVSISQGTIALKILKDSDRCACGVLFEDVAKHRYVVESDHVIIATGGLGQIYKNTTNPLVSTGDGVVMAYEAGAELLDIEMVQFHPTACLVNDEPFLITEAIRGEGARLKNANGDFFASKYHELADLAPRDVLSRAILAEMKVTNSNNVYLDLSNFTKEYFEKRFPTIYQYCLDNKISLFEQGIPVAPAAHYFIGGIKTKIDGSTNVQNLWSVGESACSGFHGANRLASNSLLECIAVPQLLVSSLLSKGSTGSGLSNDHVEISKVDFNKKDITSIVTELKERNLSTLGPVRNLLSLKTHREWLKMMLSRFKVDELSSNYATQELKNMLLITYLINDAAIKRENSLGVHYREDFPELPKSFEHSVTVKSVESSFQLQN